MNSKFFIVRLQIDENHLRTRIVCDTNGNVASNEFEMIWQKDEGGCQVYL